ncbi:hypothetical protein V7S43_007568 [Phytophthora oleae]|uniref:Uncharacterized protein n=1 Tax=Phytophthora oleae TaxID=2107226 RepID=A0ABD3FLK6_9STRA
MPIMQKFVFPMRETMPFFVSSLRAVDDWKRIHAKRADAITQAEHEANANYVKSPFARSMNVEDLLRFLDDTVLDINFMVQLPSIEKCLDKWWRLYAHEKRAIDQDILRNVYYDLAFVLVEATTETIHKNSVSMIMRSSWTKWSSKEPPLSKSEFFRLLFILAHLMTATDRLGDYIIFFHDTMGKISRNYRQKQTRAEQHSRRPRMRRKSTLDEILNTGRPLSPIMLSERTLLLSPSGGSPNQILKVQVGRVPMQEGKNRLLSVYMVVPHSHELFMTGTADLSEDEDQTEGCFVELLERNSKYHRVVVDPLLNDKRFQEKFRQPGGGVNSNTTSMNDMLVALNPISNKYCPPLLASRLRTSTSPAKTPAAASINQNQTFHSTDTEMRLSSPSRNETIRNDSTEQRLHNSNSAPAINSTPAIRDKYGSSKVDNGKALTPLEEELMRRSLSRVTLKNRVDRNKVAGAERLKNRGHENLDTSPKKEQAKKNIYLAIST